MPVNSSILQFIARAVILFGVSVFVLTFLGCTQQVATFEPDLVHIRKQKDVAKELDDFEAKAAQTRVKDIQYVMTRFFGTPDEPRLPEIEGMDLSKILDLDMLQVAAGSGANSRPGDERGLYRKLCARCHGITGNGIGREALTHNPYPRDYRLGIFKFKRTPSTLPPTNADLHNLLVRGVPGTAMPSFRLLTEVEREVLVQYVRYLAIRGLFERAIIEEAAFELLEEGQLLLDPDLRPSAFEEQLDILREIAAEVIQPWLNPESELITVPPQPADYASDQSIARGRELFFTTLTNCATCHGPTALGDGQTADDYDEWAKQLDPTNPEVLSDYLGLGALPPRKSQPRNLHDGIYRGGHHPADLFVKIKNGIAGTTMPNVAAQLSDEEIWHLVAYARYLPFDPINRPASQPAEETPAAEAAE